MEGPNPNLDREATEDMIKLAAKEGWSVFIDQVSNGLGPTRVYDYWKLVVKPEHCKTILLEKIDKPFAQYLLNKYPEIKQHGNSIRPE